MLNFSSQQKELTQAVEQYLESCMPSPDKFPYSKVLEAMNYSLLAGGKRVRAVIALSFFRLFYENFHKALPIAAAIEMIHAYSLIHDDLPCMDDDDMRRGKPSCHIAFDESTALLAGDALLTMAFTMVTEADFPADMLLNCVKLLSESAGVHGMIGGQQMDLEGEHKKLTAQELDDINGHKTGALFRASAGMGCILGGADKEQIAAAREYASLLGLAFQIQDDILDVTADSQTLGKPVGSDKQSDKNTYAALLGVERCKEIVADFSQKAGDTLIKFPGDKSFLMELTSVLRDRKY